MDQIGRYRVLRELGHGGMGQVFLAKDPALERRVALKMLRANPVQSTLRDEAKALAALSHANIVTVYEIGEHEGREFIAMEYVPGTTLRHRLEAGASRAELLAIVAKVVEALAAAHQAGILHRDIKPENILVGERGEVKVVDFGIAWRVESEQRILGRAVTAREPLEPLATLPGIGAAPTLAAQVGAVVTAFTAATNTLYGTPAYMAPELLHGAAPTEASDVYSLGVLLYECVKGERPHHARTLAELIARIIEKPVARPDDPLGELIERLLAHDPEVRPSLAEVAAALRPKVPLHRRPWVLAAAVAAIVATGAGALWLTRPAPAPTQPTVLVAPIEVRLADGKVQPEPLAAAHELVEIFEDLGVVQGRIASPEAQDATHALHVRVEEKDHMLHARVELVELATGRIVDVQPIVQRSKQLSSLLSAIALRSARQLVVAERLDSQFARKRYLRGKALLDDAQFDPSRPYLEQAVEADPDFGDAWYALALTYAWLEEPLDRVMHATTRAAELATDPRRRELMRGAGLMLTGKFAEARAALEPLLPKDAEPVEHRSMSAPQPQNSERRELRYFLGEANWHDGRYGEGYKHFRRILDEERFRPAMIHAMQYALARRDRINAPLLTGLLAENPDIALFALGEYTMVADGPATRPDMRAYAYELLERPIPDELLEQRMTLLDADSFRIARALAAGDTDAARARFTRAWDTIRKDPNPGAQYSLESLAEVMLVAGRGDEASAIARFMAEQSKTGRPMRGFPRLAILTAGITRDRSLLAAPLTERDGTLARAIAAELDGDLETAATLLDGLVRDPSFTWDYPERAALLRVLRAAGDDARGTALCEDSMRPAVYRHAFSVLRRVCRTR